MTTINAQVATTNNIINLLPKIRLVCSHDVTGQPLGSMCGCAAIGKMVEQL